MNCKKVQELILTDYLDNHMDERERESLEKHTAGCASCKAFLKEALKVEPGLFASARKDNPPEIIWRRIEAAIMSERETKPSRLCDFLERARYIFYIPKPALAIATVLTLMLIVGATARLYMASRAPVNGALEEYTLSLDYLEETPSDVAVKDDADFGTAIEQYFL